MARAPRSLPRALTARTRVRRGALAVLAAIACGPVAGTVAAPAAHAAPTAIESGDGLDWGLRESWRRYIGAGGTTASDGATVNPDGTFHFPIGGGSYDPDTRTTVVRFGGRVQFLGHCDGGGFERPCALDLTLANPRVELTEEGGFLYAKMASRPIEGGEIVDLPDVRLAAVDIEDAQPAIGGGVTRWSGLPATITAEGSTVFTYPVGSALDLLTFAYDGPGGKPAGETWSEPGIALFDPTPLPGASFAPTRLYPGFDAGTTVARDGQRIAVVDRATLAPLSANAVVEPVGGRDSIAVDPRSRTIFGIETFGRKRLFAYTWDGAALTGGPLAGTDAGGVTTDPALQGAGVWDPHGRRYLAVRVYPNRQELWQVAQDGGAWVASRIDTIRGIDGVPFTVPIASLAAVPSGDFRNPQMFVAATWAGGPLLKLATDGVVAGVSPLPQGGSIRGEELIRVRNGLYAFDAEDGITFFPLTGENSWDMMEKPRPSIRPTGLPLADLNRWRSWIAGDRSASVFYAVITGGTQVARIEGGAVTGTFALPGGRRELKAWDDRLAGVAANGDLLLGSAPDGGPETVTRLAYARTTPSIARAPQDTAVTLAAADGSGTARFAVAAAGDPAPALRWQSRVPGGSWTDLADGTSVAGASTAALTVTVGAADSGRQFRAIAQNTAGEVAGARATLTVKTPPSVVVQPDPVTVLDGASARFRVMPSGTPEPAVDWQQRVNGFWRQVDPQSGDVVADGGTLTIPSATVAMSGAQFRARLRNDAGTAFSRPVTLTVEQALTQPVRFGGGHVDWGVSERWRCYVVGNVARGAIEPEAGVERIPGTLASGQLCNGRNAGSEALRFPVRSGSFDPRDGRLELSLRGSVRFRGHDYHRPGDPRPQLDTRFSNLRIVADGTTGTLYADAVGATMDRPDPVTRTNVPLVTVDLAGTGPVRRPDGLDWSALPTVLTAQGGEVFGSYRAGEAFDPLTLAPVYGEPQPDPVPAPKPAPAPAPAAAPAPKPTPKPAARASVTVAKTAVRLDRRRTARVATVACPARARSACRIAAPARVRVRAAGRSFAVRVLAPKTVRAGRRAAVRVRLPAVAATRLAGHRASVRIALVTTVDGARERHTLNATITAKRRR
ncbi:HtaA domain-containing protein [Conexibacter woesei]|nr:HtaA domain-containing protein [Conexibacter woesei]